MSFVRNKTVFWQAKRQATSRTVPEESAAYQSINVINQSQPTMNSSPSPPVSSLSPLSSSSVATAMANSSDHSPHSDGDGERSSTTVCQHQQRKRNRGPAPNFAEKLHLVLAIPECNGEYVSLVQPLTGRKCSYLGLSGSYRRRLYRKHRCCRSAYSVAMSFRCQHHLTSPYSPYYHQ